MTASRMEAAHVTAADEVARLTAQFSSRGTLGAGFASRAMDERRVAAFGDAVRGVAVDYLAVAADARMNDQEFDELKTRYFDWAEGLMTGLKQQFASDLVHRLAALAMRDA